MSNLEIADGRKPGAPRSLDERAVRHVTIALDRAGQARLAVKSYSHRCDTRERLCDERRTVIRRDSRRDGTKSTADPYAADRRSRQISRAIVRGRPSDTPTGELAKLIGKAAPHGNRARRAA